MRTAIHIGFRVHEDCGTVQFWKGEPPVEVQAKHHPLSNSDAVCLLQTNHYVWYPYPYTNDCIGCLLDLIEHVTLYVLYLSGEHELHKLIGFSVRWVP
jgi:hypothetical protein